MEPMPFINLRAGQLATGQSGFNKCDFPMKSMLKHMETTSELLGVKQPSIPKETNSVKWCRNGYNVAANHVLNGSCRWLIFSSLNPNASTWPFLIFSGWFDHLPNRKKTWWHPMFNNPVGWILTIWQSNMILKITMFNRKIIKPNAWLSLSMFVFTTGQTSKRKSESFNWTVEKVHIFVCLVVVNTRQRDQLKPSATRTCYHIDFMKKTSISE